MLIFGTGYKRNRLCRAVPEKYRKEDGKKKERDVAEGRKFKSFHYHKGIGTFRRVRALAGMGAFSP